MEEGIQALVILDVLSKIGGANLRSLRVMHRGLAPNERKERGWMLAALAGAARKIEGGDQDHPHRVGPLYYVSCPLCG